MPLREFGGRAAGGALGLQHGNTLTDAAGDILVNFTVPFGAVPDVVPAVLDAANNYKVTLRVVNALWFTAHVESIGINTVLMGAVADITDHHLKHTGIGGVVGHDYGVGGSVPIKDSGHAHNVAAPAGVMVMWIAVS